MSTHIASRNLAQDEKVAAGHVIELAITSGMAGKHTQTCPAEGTDVEVVLPEDPQQPQQAAPDAPGPSRLTSLISLRRSFQRRQQAARGPAAAPRGVETVYTAW